MADDRFPLARSLSITETMFDKVRRRSAAISFSPFQNASSRLTLVLWPPMTIERLVTEDFISPPPTSSPSSDYSSDPVSPRAPAGARDDVAPPANVMQRNQRQRRIKICSKGGGRARHGACGGAPSSLCKDGCQAQKEPPGGSWITRPGALRRRSLGG